MPPLRPPQPSSSRPPQLSSPSPGVGEKGEWTGFDSGLGRLETEEGGEGSVVISREVRAPRLPATLACPSGVSPQQNGKNIVGLLFTMINV